MDSLGPSPIAGPADVEKQLAKLWSEATSEEAPVMRACTLNIVVACADGGQDPADATRQVAEISRTMPCRALVVSTDRAPDGGNDLDVFVSAHCHRGAGGAQICSEQITLAARGASGLELVPGTVLQLLVEDLPVVTWWRRSGLAREGLLAGLLQHSDWLLVDSAGFEDPRKQLQQLHEISSDGSWRGRAADVGWARLEPWREALASFFDAGTARPWLRSFTVVTITGGGAEREATGAARYLAGWLAARLGWAPAGRPGRWRRADGAPVRIEFLQDADFPVGEIASARIEAERDGGKATFTARRVEGSGEFVLLSVETGGHDPPPQRIELPARDAAALLCGTLQNADRDVAFAAALRDAARI